MAPRDGQVGDSRTLLPARMGLRDTNADKDVKTVGYTPLDGGDGQPGIWAGAEERLGFWDGVVALAVSMLGTGVVAFPYAFRLCGAGVGPAALLAVGAMAHLSYTALIACTRALGVCSYAALLHSVPRVWGHYTKGALWFLLMLAADAYVLISGDIIRNILLPAAGEVPPALRDPVLFAVILAMMFPFCLTTSIRGLSGITAYCSGAIVAVAGLIVWEAAVIHLGAPLARAERPAASTDAMSTILALPILGCAMFGHMNLSQTYAELRPEVKARARAVSLTACTGVGTLYVAVGLAGYIAFGRGSAADVVAQLAARDGEGGVVRAMQALLASFIVLKTPLVILPLRSLTLSLAAPDKSLSDLPLQRNALMTLALFACVYTMAVALPDLGRLLEVLGCLCVVPLCFVVPARLSWAIEEPRPTARSLLMGTAGVVVSLLALAAVLSRAAPAA